MLILADIIINKVLLLVMIMDGRWVNNCDVTGLYNIFHKFFYLLIEQELTFRHAILLDTGA